MSNVFNQTAHRISASRQTSRYKSEPDLLLVNPWIYDFAAYDFWLKPTGLLRIGSFLRQFGYQIELIDCLDRFHPAFQSAGLNYHPEKQKSGTGKFYREIVLKPVQLQHIPRFYSRYGLPVPLFEQQLNQVASPAVILVTSGMTYWYPGVFHAVALLKQKWPDVPVVLGGIYASLCPEHARLSGADFVIQGPGELPALQLVDQLTGNIRDYANIPVIPDELPYPAYDLYAHLPAVPLLTSGGCPFKCPFCATFLLAPHFIQRQPAKVLEEILFYYQQFNVRDFAFWDDALLIHPEEHIKVILKLILAAGIEANFHLPNGIHPREMTPELAELMVASRFKTIRLSFESADPVLQQKMGNKVTNRHLEAAISFLKAAGYHPADLDVYLMMGLPGQNPAEVEQSLNFVHELGAKIRLSSFSPIPGTSDWQRVVREYGFPDDLDPLLTNNSIHPLHQNAEEYAQFEVLKKLATELNLSLNY